MLMIALTILVTLVTFIIAGKVHTYCESSVRSYVDIDRFHHAFISNLTYCVQWCNSGLYSPRLKCSIEMFLLSVYTQIPLELYLVSLFVCMYPCTHKYIGIKNTYALACVCKVKDVQC